MNTSYTYKERKHYVIVDKSWLPEDYEKHVDEKLLNVKFKPDTFQKQAFYFLSRHESVFISAHTSAGKTLIAEYAIALSFLNDHRTIYTSPIKALSNQKFYDFKQKYDDVGIITGDVQVNPSANCLIMTTEILRNLIYKNNDILHNTKYIIFDEVHYINDQERGVVWEECLIMLPKNITLILLSATIPNSSEFSDWVGRTKNKTIYIISTDKRPVPLEHLIYSDREVYRIKEVQRGCKLLSNIRADILPYNKKTTTTGRFNILNLANFVVRKRLTPCIFFCFSKRKCESIVDHLSSLDLTTPIEKRDINEFLRKAIEQLPVEDRSLPQVQKLKDATSRGMAAHHGALLPFVKECIEILFSLNLIKILIATETFAMGVNMPAKCVVFLSLNKIDNDTFRNLTNGEYTQMSGRAGRRGMDKVGTVLIADEKTPSIATIKKVTEGFPLSLQSQFRLSFGLILIALRSNIKVEDIMKKSYKEHFKQKTETSDMNRLKELEKLEFYRCNKMIEYARALRSIYSQNYFLLSKYKIIKPNDIVLLCNNEVGLVIENSNDKIILKDYELHYTDTQCSNYLVNLKEYLKYPHNVRLPLTQKSVHITQVFCILVDNKLHFDYKLQNGADFLIERKLQEISSNLGMCKCDTSQNIVEHYVQCVNHLLVKDEISRIKLQYSVNNLDLIKEYDNRLLFLRKNNFCEDQVTLKGRVAAEIRTVNEVLATEMIFDNTFKHLQPDVIVSLFSSMIYETEMENNAIYDDLLNEGVRCIQLHFNRLSKDIDSFLVPPFKPLNFSLMQAVYEWCNKETLRNIVTRYDVSEGEFVRLVLRLDECCREMLNASAVIEDEVLEQKFKQAALLLKRDIVFLPSLYL